MHRNGRDDSERGCPTCRGHAKTATLRPKRNKGRRERLGKEGRGERGLEQGGCREGEEGERQGDEKGDWPGAEGTKDGSQGKKSLAKDWEYSGYDYMA